jgi:hypothetical protein
VYFFRIRVYIVYIQMIGPLISREAVSVETYEESGSLVVGGLTTTSDGFSKLFKQAGHKQFA